MKRECWRQKPIIPASTVASPVKAASSPVTSAAVFGGSGSPGSASEFGFCPLEDGSCPDTARLRRGQEELHLSVGGLEQHMLVSFIWMLHYHTQKPPPFGLRNETLKQLWHICRECLTITLEMDSGCIVLDSSASRRRVTQRHRAVVCPGRSYRTLRSSLNNARPHLPTQDTHLRII